MEIVQAVEVVDEVSGGRRGPVEPPVGLEDAPLIPEKQAEAGLEAELLEPVARLAEENGKRRRLETRSGSRRDRVTAHGLEKIRPKAGPRQELAEHRDVGVGAGMDPLDEP